METIISTPFQNYVNDSILNPLELSCIQFGKTLASEKLNNEVTYYDLENAKPVRSVFDGLAKGPYPYAGRHHEAWGEAGAWVASSVDIVRFVNHVDGTKKPRILSPQTIKLMTGKQNFPEHKQGFWYGLGWRIQKKRDGLHWYHNGSSNLGAASLMLRSKDGLVWSANFNRRMPKGRALYKEFNKRIWAIVKKTKKWPTHDLFPSYPCKEI